MATPLIDNVTLTDDFADNFEELPVKNSGAIVLHVQYTKGTEAFANIQIQVSTILDDDGSEIWCDWADVDHTHGVVEHLVNSDPFRLEAGGNFRFPVMPISPREDKIRIRVRSNIAGGGTMTVFAIPDNFYYGA